LLQIEYAGQQIEISYPDLKSQTPKLLQLNRISLFFNNRIANSSNKLVIEIE